MNVTGFCSRLTCPLANSNYATIRSIDNTLYLFVKTIERAHTPSKMWEKIKLSKNYQTALEQIDQELEYWPEYLIHRNKQRLTKLTQMLIRMRRLIMKKDQTELVPIKKKLVRRERTRERKALSAARLEMTIEKELLDRLKKGVYGDDMILNESQEAFSKALDTIEQENEMEQDQDFDQDMDDEEEEDDFDREFVSDFSESSDEEDGASVHSDDGGDDSDSSDSSSSSSSAPKPKKKKTAKRGGQYVRVEYEEENETQRQSQPQTELDW